MGTLHRDMFPKGTKTSPTASPKGTLALRLAHPGPPFLHHKFFGVGYGVRHMPSGQNPPGAMMPNSHSTEWG